MRSGIVEADALRLEERHGLRVTVAPVEVGEHHFPRELERMSVAVGEGSRTRRTT